MGGSEHPRRQIEKSSQYAHQYRSQRRNEMMTMRGEELTDAEIANLRRTTRDPSPS
jgi:hypothetical protein